jgi:lipoate-protein ligase B
MSELLYVDLGRIPYGKVDTIQRRLVEEVNACGEDRSYLLLGESDPPAVTMGKDTKHCHIILTAEQLAEKGIVVHESNRGGDVTYHGPGELLAVSILRLDLHGASGRGYMRMLEEVAIRVVARYGITAGRMQGVPGAWVGNEKIAATGVAINDRVTYFGFAINVSPNLEHFGYIVPCGLHGKGVTSIERLTGRQVSVAEVKTAVVECMVAVFGFDGFRQVRLRKASAPLPSPGQPL